MDRIYFQNQTIPLPFLPRLNNETLPPTITQEGNVEFDDPTVAQENALSAEAAEVTEVLSAGSTPLLY